MGWFGFGGRKSRDEATAAPVPVPTAGGEKVAGEAEPTMTVTDVPPPALNSQALPGSMADEQAEASTTTNRGVPTAPLKITSGGDTGVETTVSLEGEQEGYLARLKKAMSESIDTAKTAPETFEEALAVLRGEREVKPDYERAAYTVSASFAGGCAHGWWNSAALAAKYPPHQRKAVRVRAGAGKGARFAAFALVFEGSSAVMEALRKKKDFVGGSVGGGLAGMAYSVSGGLAAARRGLFYGVWLGGMFGLFRNHIASLKEHAVLAEEDAMLAQEERDVLGKSALSRSIRGLDAQLETWPTAREDPTERKPSLTQAGGDAKKGGR